MQTVIIVIHLMLVLALIGVVLLQRSEGGGLGMGSGGGAGFMSSRGTANLLTRTTAFLAVGFFVTSLFCRGLPATTGRRRRSSIRPRRPPCRARRRAVPPSGGNILDNLKAREGSGAAGAAVEISRLQRSMPAPVMDHQAGARL